MALQVTGQTPPKQEADSLFALQHFALAKEKYEIAAATFQKNNDTTTYVICHIQITRCLLNLGQLDVAIQSGQHLLTYLTKVAPEAAHLMVSCELTLSEAYLKSGRNDLSIQHLQHAEAVLPADTTLLAAQCFNDLGVVYWNSQNTELARLYHEKALQIRKERLSSQDVLLADSYLNLGLIEQETNFLTAILHYNEALSIYEAVAGKNSAEVALCYTNLAFANSSQQNFLEALSFLNKTREIWDFLFAGDHPNKAFVLSQEGRIYEAQGNYPKALQMQQEALKMYLRLFGKKHPEVANTYQLIGSVQMKQQRYRDAAESFQEAVYANLYTQNYQSLYDLPQVTEYYHADILLAALQNKAQALEALHYEKTLSPRDLKGALLTYQICDDLIRQIRQIRLSEQDKIRIGRTAVQVYDNGIRIALYLAKKTFRSGYYQSIAFQFCESSKSAVLLEAIGDTKAQSFAGIPDELLAEEDSLKNQMAWIERQLASAEQGQQQIWKNAWLSTRQHYQEFIRTLEISYPNYFQLKYQTSSLTPAALQQQLDPATAVISYFIGEQDIYVFTLTGKSFSADSRPLDDHFHQYTRGFRNAIRYRVSEPLDLTASSLYEQLIPPLSDQIRQLIIIPDGILGTLPFEALIRHKGRDTTYLAEQYAVSYTYAASLLQEQLQTPGGTASGILLEAPVTFSDAHFLLATLPQSEQEVKEIRYLFLSGRDTPKMLLQNEATESVIKSNALSNYRYLHFATHGLVNEMHPELSRIFLSADSDNDGNLYSGEIYGLQIHADLVTLSACETGLGKVEKGEGIIGLSRSLMYAGAHNLLVSLWPVADASTAELMIAFYQQHLRHEQDSRFSRDLRTAKLKLIHSEAYSDPYFWAPFILIGR